MSLAVQGKDTDKISVATCYYYGNLYWLSYLQPITNFKIWYGITKMYQVRVKANNNVL